MTISVIKYSSEDCGTCHRMSHYDSSVINELGLDKEIINVNGGAISLGHPLGCTGAKLSVQLFDEMRKRSLNNKYGLVTMCVGTGQGAAGIFEFVK